MKKETITIKKILDNVFSNKYLLPEIQREFEWEPNQILRLLDSLMRDYPIGIITFWDVSKKEAKKINFLLFHT